MIPNIFNQNIFNFALYDGGLQELQQNSNDNIVFNNFGLQNSMFCTQYVKHESGPSRDFDTSDVPRDDGQNLQDAFYKSKIIKLKGALVTSSNSELLTQIDLTKKFLNKLNGELKIIEGNITRIYIASCSNMSNIFSNRDHFHKNWVPYDIDFTCFTPFGRDLTRTTRDDFSETAAAINIELSNTGTIKNRLITYITFGAAADVTKINWKNNTNDEEIEITQAFSVGDIIKIDGENTKITVNGTEVDFNGFPPQMNTGANSFTLTITSTSHSVSISNKFYNYYL